MEVQRDVESDADSFSSPTSCVRARSESCEIISAGRPLFRDEDQEAEAPKLRRRIIASETTEEEDDNSDCPDDNGSDGAEERDTEGEEEAPRPRCKYVDDEAEETDADTTGDEDEESQEGSDSFIDDSSEKEGEDENEEEDEEDAGIAGAAVDLLNYTATSEQTNPNSFSALIRVGLSAATEHLCFENTSISSTCEAHKQQDFHTLKQRFSEALCLEVFVDFFYISQFSLSTGAAAARCLL
jgi:hypothetical protein